MHPVPMLPLDSSPGWQAVNNPSALELLNLTVFLPFGIAAVVALVVLAPSWRKAR